jgi:hypothetical protein
MGSSSIFSMALGPRHDLMMSATVLAAVMLESWALRPNCRSPPGVCVSVVGVLVGGRSVQMRGTLTHNYHGRLHLDGVSKQTLLRRKRGLFGEGVGYLCGAWQLYYARYFFASQTLSARAPATIPEKERRCSGQLRVT